MKLVATLDATLSEAPLGTAVDALRDTLARTLATLRHGDAAEWGAAIDTLPRRDDARIDLLAPALDISTAQPLTAAEHERLVAGLQALHPWRKGPFSVFGVHVDSEWRSDWKWARVAPHIAPLAGRRVLDVGCGNGYYAWRMLGAGARFVLGVDPALRSLAQFEAVRRYVPGAPALLLPLRGEDLPDGLACFDTVFSMGVIYHRRAPLEHLAELRAALVPGGELVLETLVIEAAPGAVLAPNGRYAKMGNVWRIPAPGTALDWLRQAGFADARLVDIAPTTQAEQRRTDWMRFESLADFLDPNDPRRTVEGHPAPVRAVFIAHNSP